jgi:hypothetical protein
MLNPGCERHDRVIGQRAVERPDGLCVQSAGGAPEALVVLGLGWQAGVGEVWVLVARAQVALAAPPPLSVSAHSTAGFIHIRSTPIYTASQRLPTWPLPIPRSLRPKEHCIPSIYPCIRDTCSNAGIPSARLLPLLTQSQPHCHQRKRNDTVTTHIYTNTDITQP